MFTERRAAQLYPGMYNRGHGRSCLCEMSLIPTNSPNSNLGARAEIKLDELERRIASVPESQETPSWPSGAKVIKVLLLILVLIVLIGWGLSALNR